MDCTGPGCPESDCRCAPGTVLGPDSQTCLGETDRQTDREREEERGQISRATDSERTWKTNRLEMVSEKQ